MDICFFHQFIFVWYVYVHISFLYAFHFGLVLHKIKQIKASTPQKKKNKKKHTHTHTKVELNSRQALFYNVTCQLVIAVLFAINHSYFVIFSLNRAEKNRKKIPKNFAPDLGTVLLPCILYIL